LHTALLTLAIWLAPWAAGWATAPAEAEGGKPSLAGVVYSIAQGGLVGVMLVLCLIYLRGQTAFIYFQF